MKVNDLIFKELLRRGYSLEGNTRIWNIADSKLWYLTPEQAQAYLDLEHSKDYQNMASNPEFQLVEENIEDFFDYIKENNINVVDLGCGDGEKAAHIIEHLLKKKKIRYCPIDISAHMVKKSVETLSKTNVGEIIETQWNISDFENLENVVPLLEKGEFKRNLFMLLGYTLGNFEINELLYTIYNAMNDDDVFTAVVGLGDNRWEERAKTAKNHAPSNEFFKQVPLQLGLSEKEIEFGSRFKNSRIEFYYTLKKDKTVKFQDKKVDFTKGDQIIVAVAYKQKEDEISEIFGMYFEEIILKTSEDKSTGLVICRKSKK